MHTVCAAIKLPDPAELPSFIESAEEHLPKKIPAADICIATGIHRDLLLALSARLDQEGIRGLITPIEDFREVPSGLRKQLEDQCNELSVEYACPKPFCVLEPSSNTPLISQFVRDFKIGKPSLRIAIGKQNNRRTIQSVIVERSAPCGSTWYVARKIIGKETLKEEIQETVAKAHHSYPCTATMSIDPEIGEPVLHEAGYLIREAVEDQLLV